MINTLSSQKTTVPMRLTWVTVNQLNILVILKCIFVM